LFFSELKRRLKAEQQAKEKAQREKEKGAALPKPKPSSDGKPAGAAASEEEISPNVRSSENNSFQSVYHEATVSLLTVPMGRT
jgi:hypothetical protein